MAYIRQIIILIAVALSSSTYAKILSTKGPIALATKQAPELFEKCWCGDPKNAEPFWLPTSEEVATMERELEKFIGTLKVVEKFATSLAESGLTVLSKNTNQETQMCARFRLVAVAQFSITKFRISPRLE